MNVTRPIIEHCVDVELEAARKEHEEFHSLHEAYAVTLEEVQETESELEMVKLYMNDVWDAAKDDMKEEAEKAFKRIEEHAVNLAAEAVQVAAMARKARTPSVTGVTAPSGREPLADGHHQTKTWLGKE